MTLRDRHRDAAAEPGDRDQRQYEVRPQPEHLVPSAGGFGAVPHQRLRRPYQEERCRGRRHDRCRAPPEDVQPDAVGVLTHELRVVAHEHDEHQERGREDAVEDGGQKEHADRARLEEIEQHATRDRARKDEVEVAAAPRGEVEPRPPAEDLGDGKGGRASQDRDRQEPRADQPEREEEVGGVAGERPQGFGGLARRRDLGEPRAVEGRRRREDDEVHHDVREEHARVHVEPGVGELVRRRAAPLRRRSPAARLLLLDLLRRLPEEEIGRDRRAEDPDERGDVGGVPAERRHHGGRPRLPPVGMREDRRDDVGKEHRGHPFEIFREGRVARVHGDEHDAGAEERHEGKGRGSGEHRRGLRHARQVGGDVEDVGREE